MPREKYTTHVQPYLDKIIELRQKGYSENNIANELGINPRTFYKYVKEYKELQDSIVEGDKQLVDTLESSLYKRAIGFTYNEINGKGETITRYALPSETALIFCLCNLKPDKWKREKSESNTKDNLKFDINIITDKKVSEDE